VLALGAYALAAWLQSPAQAPASSRAIWAFTVNEVAAADVEVIVRADGPWVPLAALEREGIGNLPPGNRETVEGQVFVALASLAPAVRFVLDEDLIQLRLTVAPEFLPRQNIALVNERPENLRVSRPLSAFFNYVGTYRNTGGSDLLAQAAVSARGWSLYNTGLFREHGPPVRGVTTLTFDQVRKRRRWTMGDVLGGASPLGSAPLVGGFSVARETLLDPYYTTFAMPELEGSVLTPSTATVYVAGNQVSEFALRPGPFLLEQLPISSGLGRLDLVVRDSSGATRTLSIRYYLGTTLLRRGEQEYRYLAGAERTFDGTTATYDRTLGTAFHRIGLSDTITIGYQAEGDKNVVSAGPLLDFRLWRAGTIGLAASSGGTDDSRGTAASFTYDFQSRVISVQSRVTKLWRGYTNLYVDPLRQDRIFADGTASMPVLRRGTVTLRWLTRSVLPDSVSYPALPYLPGINRLGLVPNAARLRSANDLDLRRELSLGGSVALPRGTRLYGLVNHVSERSDRWWEGFVSLSVSLGGRMTATVTGSQSRNTTNVTADLYRSAPLGPGIGFRVAADEESDRAVGEVVLQHQRGAIRSFLNRQSDGTTDGFVEISGGIAAAGGRIGLLPFVDDGFALVRVPNSPHVRVYANHEPVGRTSGAGVLFVPAIQSYLGNAIGIASEDVPVEVTLGETERIVSPASRGGVVVVFDARVVKAFTGLLRIRLGENEVVPSYGSLDVDAPGGPYSSPLNGDGYFYLEEVPPGKHTARIGYGGGESCRFTLQIPSSSETTVDLGVIMCNKSE
jgi:outer membrane usher protein